MDKVLFSQEAQTEITDSYVSILMVLLFFDMEMICLKLLDPE